MPLFMLLLQNSPREQLLISRHIWPIDEKLLWFSGCCNRDSQVQLQCVPNWVSDYLWHTILQYDSELRRWPLQRNWFQVVCILQYTAIHRNSTNSKVYIHRLGFFHWWYTWLIHGSENTQCCWYFGVLHRDDVFDWNQNKGTKKIFRK